jgi:hypothetical protein
MMLRSCRGVAAAAAPVAELNPCHISCAYQEQVYLLLSACPCEGRISGIVDVPNAVATLAIPLAIFDQDVRPKAGNVLEALAKGVKVQMVGRDLARQTVSVPQPNDPRLPDTCPPCAP